MPIPIEQERSWEHGARRTRQDSLLRWVLVAMAVAIVVVLALVATSHSQNTNAPFSNSGSTVVDSSTTYDVMPGFWHLVETHCVAVLTEAHVERVNRGRIGFDPPQEVDKDGNEIRHVAEQTLKLRCR